MAGSRGLENKNLHFNSSAQRKMLNHQFRGMAD